MRFQSGIVDQYLYFVAVDSTDYVTRETGLSTFTVYRSRNGAAAAAYTTPTINETDVTNMPGVYELLLDEDMTIDAGDDSQDVVLHITHAGMAPVTLAFELYRPVVTAGRTLDVSAGGEAGLDWANVGSPTTTVALTGTTIATTQKVDVETIKTNPVVNAGTIIFPTGATLASTTNITAGTITTTTNLTNLPAITAGWLTETGIAADAITAAKLAADVTTELQSGLATAAALATLQTTADDILTDTGTTLPSTLSTIAGYIDTEIGSIITAIGDLPTNAELATALGTADDATLAAIAALSIPTANQNADALLDRAAGVETGLTIRQWARLTGSVLIGKVSGGGTGTEVFRDFGDTKDRITATVDSNGNRTAITRDAT